jgi:hypothetical protein
MTGLFFDLSSPSLLLILALKINPHLAENYLLVSRADWGLFFGPTCARMRLFDSAFGA